MLSYLPDMVYEELGFVFDGLAHKTKFQYKKTKEAKAAIERLSSTCTVCGEKSLYRIKHYGYCERHINIGKARQLAYKRVYRLRGKVL